MGHVRVTLVGSGNAVECSAAIAATVLGRPWSSDGSDGRVKQTSPTEVLAKLCPSPPCGIGGVSQPSVRCWCNLESLISTSISSCFVVCCCCCASSQKVEGLGFLAMSMHFYAVDCMRTLLPRSSATAAFHDRWPQPSIGEISRAAVDWCQLTWSNLSTGKLGTHELTSPDKLPHRCCALLFCYVAALRQIACHLMTTL